ncbi:MAG: hypothetical protein ACSW75_03815 [Lachnospiraceae bacterium]
MWNRLYGRSFAALRMTRPYCAGFHADGRFVLKQEDRRRRDSGGDEEGVGLAPTSGNAVDGDEKIEQCAEEKHDPKQDPATFGQKKQKDKANHHARGKKNDGQKVQHFLP